MADVKTSAFMLSSATLMLGRAFVDDVFALTPDKHSVGMVSEVNISIDSSLTSLANGVAQAEVDAKRTGVTTSITANVFEMTADNLLRAQALSGAGAGVIRRGVLTANAAAGASTLQLASDPIPGEATSSITAIGDIPSGSSIILQRVNGETDFVFPTVTTGAATVSNGIYTIPITGNFILPGDMPFAAGSRVWVVTPVPVGALDADELFCAKIVGTLSNFERPVMYVAPKVRMVKGFSLSFNETQYSSMPWEMRPQMLSRGEVNSLPRLGEIGTRRSARLYVGAGGSAITTGTPVTPTPAPTFTTNPSISPTSGTAGTTTFTANSGAVSNGAVASRRWLLNGNSIGTGTTVSPTSAQTGSLVLEVTATGPGGTTVASSTAITVAAVATGPVTKAFPSGFAWNTTTYPMTITKQAGVYSVDVDPKARHSAAFGGTAYYVSPTGSNAADGLTAATAVRSIGVAVNKFLTSANAAARIIIKEGEYARENDLVDSANTNGLQAALVNGPTKPIAYIGDPTNTTKPLIGPFFRPTTWTADSGAYIAARSAVIRVLFKDANGKYSIDATARTTAADVNTGEGWYQDGGNIRIRRPDGAAVTNANTLVIVSGNNFKAGSSNVPIYMEGLEVVGSVSAALDFRAAATRDVALVDMDVHHAGALPAAGVGAGTGQAAGQNNISFNSQTGFAGLWRCRAYGATTDGINGHGDTGQMYGLTVDCVGFDNGRNASTSNQGLTIHDSVIWTDVGGEYYANAGGNIRNIESTQIWGLGTKLHDDRGDAIFGGPVTPCDLILNDTAKGWFEDLVCSGSAASISTSSGATILLKNASLGGATTGVGTVSTYT